MSDINKYLFHAMLLFLMVGSIAGLFAGAALVLRPSVLLQVSARVNHWVATRKISGLLEHVFKIDRWLYRHHNATGTLLLIGAIFLFYFFTARFDKLRILIGFSIRFSIPPVFSEILIDAGVLSILLGAAFAFVVSLFLLFRPSMLKGFEQGANQWISLRRALKPFESFRDGIDAYAFHNAQMTGVLLLFGSLYTLAGLTNWL